MTTNGKLSQKKKKKLINPLNAKLNPICHVLTLLGAHHILHVSRVRVNVWMLPKLLPKLRLPKLVQLATPGISLLTVMSKHLVEIYVYALGIWAMN